MFILIYSRYLTEKKKFLKKATAIKAAQESVNVLYYTYYNFILINIIIKL